MTDPQQYANSRQSNSSGADALAPPSLSWTLLGLFAVFALATLFFVLSGAVPNASAVYFGAGCAGPFMLALSYRTLLGRIVAFVLIGILVACFMASVHDSMTAPEWGGIITAVFFTLPLLLTCMATSLVGLVRLSSQWSMGSSDRIPTARHQLELARGLALQFDETHDPIMRTAALLALSRAVAMDRDVVRFVAHGRGFGSLMNDPAFAKLLNER